MNTIEVNEEPRLTDAALDLDLESLVRDAGDPQTHEVSTNAFMAWVVATYNYTYDFARNLIYRLIDLGRAVLTNTYTLRFVG